MFSLAGFHAYPDYMLSLVGFHAHRRPLMGMSRRKSGGGWHIRVACFPLQWGCMFSLFLPTLGGGLTGLLMRR